MINEAQTGTKPAPGVIATSPTTSPVTHPTSVGFSAIRISISIQESIPDAAEIAVVAKA